MRKYRQEAIFLFVGLLQRPSSTITLTAGLVDILLNRTDFAPVSDGQNQLASRKQVGRRLSGCELFKGLAQ